MHAYARLHPNPPHACVCLGSGTRRGTSCVVMLRFSAGKHWSNFCLRALCADKALKGLSGKKKMCTCAHAWMGRWRTLTHTYQPTLCTLAHALPWSVRTLLTTGLRMRSGKSGWTSRTWSSKTSIPPNRPLLHFAFPKPRQKGTALPPSQTLHMGSSSHQAMTCSQCEARFNLDNLFAYQNAGHEQSGAIVSLSTGICHCCP